VGRVYEVHGSSSDKLSTPDLLIAALAARQHGVVSIAQLLAAGLDRDGVAYRRGLSDEVCVVVVIDPVLAVVLAETGAPEGRVSWPARRAAREGTTHHHDEHAVQAAPELRRRAA
jgi:hypothetical protein